MDICEMECENSHTWRIAAPIYTARNFHSLFFYAYEAYEEKESRLRRREFKIRSVENLFTARREIRIYRSFPPFVEENPGIPVQRLNFIRL